MSLTVVLTCIYSVMNKVEHLLIFFNILESHPYFLFCELSILFLSFTHFSVGFLAFILICR